MIEKSIADHMKYNDSNHLSDGHIFGSFSRRPSFGDPIIENEMAEIFEKIIESADNGQNLCIFN